MEGIIRKARKNPGKRGFSPGQTNQYVQETSYNKLFKKTGKATAKLFMAVVPAVLPSILLPFLYVVSQ